VLRNRAAEDRAQLRDLFAAVASVSAPPTRRKIAIAITRARPEALAEALSTGAGLRLGLSARPVADLGTNRFAGPAVRPLPILR
jgi:hypothetical protein